MNKYGIESINISDINNKKIEELKRDLKYAINTIKHLNIEKNDYKLRLDKYEPPVDININIDDYYTFKGGEINKFFPKILSRKIINAYKLMFFGNKNPYQYIDGFYQEQTFFENVISKHLSMSDPQVKKHMEDTKKMLIVDSFIDINKINPKEIVNFNNCILNLNTYKTEKHSPSILSTQRIHANYLDNQTLKGTAFYNYLKVSGCDDVLIDMILEMIGYCFTSYVEAQKMFILKGKPSTGKSTLLNFIRQLFGIDDTTSVNLEDLKNVAFLSTLIGKLVNICGDIGQGYIDNVSRLLQLTGDEVISVKRLYCDPIQTKLTTKQIFATNALPTTNDKSGAFLRRCIIIPFNKVVKESEKDPYLGSKLFKEADIIASVAIDSFKKLKNRNFNFIQNENTLIELDLYKKANNSLEQFISDYCTIDLKQIKEAENNKDFTPFYITCSEFKNFYSLFCEVEGLTKQISSIKNFMRENMDLSEKTQRKYCKVRHYVGICWKKSIKQLIEEKHKDKAFKDGIYSITSYINNSLEEANLDEAKQVFKNNDKQHIS